MRAASNDGTACLTPRARTCRSAVLPVRWTAWLHKLACTITQRIVTPEQLQQRKKNRGKRAPNNRVSAGPTAPWSAWSGVRASRRRLFNQRNAKSGHPHNVNYIDSERALVRRSCRVGGSSHFVRWHISPQQHYVNVWPKPLEPAPAHTCSFRKDISVL